MTTPAAARILAAFDGLSADARSITGALLTEQPAPFLRSLGVALGCHGTKLAELTVDRALHVARWDPADRALLDQLGADEPWATVKQALAEALGTGRPTSNGRRPNPKVSPK